MKREPLVSCLVVTWNAERFVRKTLESMTNQTYDNIEILVLDNNSEDKTLTRIYEVKAKTDVDIKIFENDENVGPYNGLNQLLDKAQGKYLAINDHDDIWHRKKIREQVRFLENNKDYVGVGTGRIDFYTRYASGTIFRKEKESDVAYHTTLMFRNEGYRYPTSVDVNNDEKFMQDVLCRDGKIRNLHRVLNLHRVRFDSGSLSKEWRVKKDVDVFSLDYLHLWLNRLLPKHVFDWLSLNVFNRDRRVDYQDVRKRGLYV